MPEQYRVQNWREYNQALCRRGSLTIWMSEEVIGYIHAHGLARWKVEQGYHLRSLAEAAIGRFKRVIGRCLRSREWTRQQTEARLGSQILNRMAALGMPRSVPVLT